ncbi:hypothetical protein Hokovirus_2_218 [Hokovirus HKV1]|uniref:Uncharacterized protein n=1 Tax=Hokovirus HKV1 TaxID=1977638 RepID=A0A1V0SG84_9VIRU|nr:hypothetical protein Hokovirus_2_218 [Hokovirus HKV1]
MEFNFYHYITFTQKTTLSKVNNLLSYFYSYELLPKNNDVLIFPKIIVKKHVHYYDLNAYVLDFHGVIVDNIPYRCIFICYLFKINKKLIDDINNNCKCSKCNKKIPSFFKCLCLKTLQNYDTYEDQNLHNNIFTQINKLISTSLNNNFITLSIIDIINNGYYDNWPFIYPKYKKQYLDKYDWFITENDHNYFKIKNLLKKNDINDIYYLIAKHQDFLYLDKWIISILYFYNNKMNKLQQYICAEAYIHKICNDIKIITHIKKFCQCHNCNNIFSLFNNKCLKNNMINSQVLINTLKYMKIIKEEEIIKNDNIITI